MQVKQYVLRTEWGKVKNHSFGVRQSEWGNGRLSPATKSAILLRRQVKGLVSGSDGPTVDRHYRESDRINDLSGREKVNLELAIANRRDPHLRRYWSRFISNGAIGEHQMQCVVAEPEKVMLSQLVKREDGEVVVLEPLAGESAPFSLFAPNILYDVDNQILLEIWKSMNPNDSLDLFWQLAPQQARIILKCVIDDGRYSTRQLDRFAGDLVGKNKLFEIADEDQLVALARQIINIDDTHKRVNFLDGLKYGWVAFTQSVCDKDSTQALCAATRARDAYETEQRRWMQTLRLKSFHDWSFRPGTVLPDLVGYIRGMSASDVAALRANLRGTPVGVFLEEGILVERTTVRRD